MKDYSTNWTKEELEAYLLIQCANADYKETDSELAKINAVIGDKGYQKIRLEYENDTDYERIQKINSTVSRLNYSVEQLELLFNEIKGMFLADGKFDQLEKNLFIGLKRLLK